MAQALPSQARVGARPPFLNPPELCWFARVELSSVCREGFEPCTQHLSKSSALPVCHAPTPLRAEISPFCHEGLCFPPSCKPRACIQLKKRSQHLPRLSTRDEDLCLQLFNTSTLQIFILSKKSINIFNHAVKDHSRMETHGRKGITRHRQPWVCHCLTARLSCLSPL